MLVGWGSSGQSNPMIMPLAHDWLYLESLDAPWSKWGELVETRQGLAGRYRYLGDWFYTAESLYLLYKQSVARNLVKLAHLLYIMLTSH